MIKTKEKTVDEYIRIAPQEARKSLKELRSILTRVAPKDKESLKWGNPVFEENRILFAYAAFKTHLNFMPTPSIMKHFKKALADFVTGKGSIQFRYDQPLPKGLIREIAALRVKELREKDVKWM